MERTYCFAFPKALRNFAKHRRIYINRQNSLATYFCHDRTNLQNWQTNKLYNPMIVTQRESLERCASQLFTVSYSAPSFSPSLILFNFKRDARLSLCVVHFTSIPSIKNHGTIYSGCFCKILR